MSQFSSTIAEKKRIIIKNPDGSYSHGEKDSIAENKEPNENNNHQQNEILTISDSELQYIVDNYEQFDHNSVIEQLLSSFRRNQIVFLTLLIIEMSLTMFLLFITWQKKETSISILQEIYKDLNSKEASILFYSVFILSCLMNSVFYPLGFFSLISKKVNVFKTFSLCALLTAIITVFIMYLNILFILIFVIRLIIYGFSRFIINLLASILVLPRVQNNLQANNNNYQTV